MLNFNTHKIQLLLVLFLVTYSTLVFGQGTQGSISGRVTDSSGAVAANASVLITNEATGVKIPLKTDKSGVYAYSSLIAGRYTVTVGAPGFNAYTKQHVQVDVDSHIVVDIPLTVGKVNESIVVSANAQQLSYDSANLGMTIEEKSITDLPLIYGNPFALEFLTPGVTLSGVNPNIHVYDSGTATVSVNGSTLNSLDYKLDGAPDNRIRYSAYTPSTEFVSQYRVSTASYDASEGHSSGGFVNVQTKAGTNQFHGSLFGYYQNPKINSNVWALSPTNSKPVFVREGFGVGGPIIKNKLFFFGGYEHSRQGNPNVKTLTVPTQAERNGDFSALLALDTTAGAQTCGTNPAVLTASKGHTINKYQLFDPLSAVSTTANNYARLCIPGNVISPSSISPIAKALLSYYPLPNQPGTTAGLNNYAYSAVEPDLYYGAIARFDYTISERQSMYGHILRSSRQNVNSSNWFPPVSGVHLDYENRGISLAHTLILSKTMVMNTAVAITRFTNQNIPTSQGIVTPESIGMPSYLTNGLPASARSLPRVDLTGYTSATTSTGIQSADNIGLASVSITKQVGGNSFHFGVEYRRYLTSAMSGVGEQGAYVIGGTQTTPNNTTSNSVGGVGFSVAQLELGTVLSSGSQTQNSDFSVVSDYYAGYLHDDWRVSKRLTLNVGLRWEYETPDIERNAKQAVAFNFGATNAVTASGAAAYKNVASLSPVLPASISPTGGFIFANTHGYGLDPYNSPKWNFLPRFGFAFAANDKTVIRGGYGIFFDSINSYNLTGGNNGSTSAFLVPQQGYSTVSNVIAPTYTPTGGLVVSTLANPFPSGLTAVSGNSLGTSTALGQNVEFLTPNPHAPYNQRWSLGFQRQLGQFIVALDYVGNHGVHQPASQISIGTNTGGREYNNVPAQYYSTVDGAYDQAENTRIGSTVTNPFYNLLPSNSANNLGAKTVAIAQLLRPYPEFASVNAFTFDGMSIYHSLQAQVQRRFTNGMSLTSAFTWSRTLDATTFLNPTDPRPWYGVSANDRPLRLALSGIYHLPWGSGRRWLSASRGVVAQLVGGWQIQGIYQAQSGAPLTFARNDVWYGNGNPGTSAWSRSKYKSSIGANGVGYWFDPSKWLQAASNPTAVANVNAVQACPTTATPVCQFAFPGTYQIRHFPLRFNSLRADNLNQADIGIQREFQIRKYGAFQFRGEAINVLNHPVYSAPNTDPENSLFGQIVSQANQPRVYQFAGFFRF